MSNRTIWRIAPVWTMALIVLAGGCSTDQAGPPHRGAGESVGKPIESKLWSVDHSPAVTFNKDIAPLIWENCSPCHRPGEAAPFTLISYDEVRKHAEQIVQVTHSRFMPPWLAESGEFAFEDEMRLTSDQIERLARWVAASTPEGQVADLPLPPTWAEGWQLGEPDLIVSMPEAFRMPATGPDVYRNFIIPIPVEKRRYARAMEFRPGNYPIVHHAFMLIDPTRSLRSLDGEGGQPGFAGMDTRTALSPDGHFIGWQPGRFPYECPEGMAWKLYPGTDLILQVHMQPTGKPES